MYKKGKINEISNDYCRVCRTKAVILPLLIHRTLSKGVLIRDNEVMRYDTYIFDLDGTLLNSIDDLAISCNYALNTFGMPQYSVDEIKSFVGNGVHKLLERSVPNGIENSKFNDVLNLFQKHYLIHNTDHTCPYTGIMDMLSQLKQHGKQVAVVSNKFCKATQELVEHYFGNAVDIAIGESDTIRKKPAPDMVLAAMRQLHATPDTAVYIGDSDVDIQTASNSGLPCISVLWGFRSRPFLIEHGAKTLVSRPADILYI